MKELTVELAPPVLVGRSREFLWFPTLVPLEGEQLLAVLHDLGDVYTNQPTAKFAWSADRGESWSELERHLGTNTSVQLSNGDRILLPYYLHPHVEGGFTGPYQVVPSGQRAVTVCKEGLRVVGFPRADRSFDPQQGLAGFVLSGNSIRRHDNTFLTTLYGHFQDATRYALVVAASSDGVIWNYLTTVADEKCPLTGKEGPCESAITRLKDGRLLCVFRLDSGCKYGQSLSADDGRTWSEPTAMERPFSVEPSLVTLTDGTVVLSGGRPGLFLWVNKNGDAQDWEQIDLLEHHNTGRVEDVIHTAPEQPPGTSSYTEVVVLDDRNVLVIYDRLANGWNAIPSDSQDTNSVWVVRATFQQP
ncbi:MAG: sialidase family protein [Pirellulaceae bacterium]